MVILFMTYSQMTNSKIVLFAAPCVIFVVIHFIDMLCLP